jgi:pimeloyl-ACP methyl ester carboxylesterase
MAELEKTIFRTRAGSILTIHASGRDGPAVFGIGGLSVRPLAISGLYETFKEIATGGKRCVLMEIAGGGESPATPGLTMDTWLADVEEIFEELVCEPAIWTGSSMGGWLMMLAHRRHPERFRSMCAIAPAIDWDQQYIVPGIRDGVLGVVNGAVVNREGTFVATRELLQSMAHHHLMDAPFRLHSPLHVIFGGRDEIVPPAAMRGFMERTQGAPCTGQLFGEAGHSIAKLEWDFAPAQYYAWVRAQIDAQAASYAPSPRGPTGRAD